MEWQKDFFNMLEAIAYEVEQFFLEVADVVESVAEEVQSTIGADIDQYLQDMFEPLAEIYAELEEIANDTDTVFTYPVEPTPEQHPACMGCRHYHGQAYGGTLFVCAMHPYGCEDQTCPDWESPWGDSSPKNL